MITYRNLGRNGRLGNQLWQIAGTISIARRKGDRAAFPFWRYGAYFRVPEEYFPPLAGVQSEDVGTDYLQDLAHLDGIEELIRGYYRPSEAVEEALHRRHRELLALPHKTAVSVRRGDYLRLTDRIPALPIEYYLEAMEAHEPPYLVFSDDLDWCEQNLPAGCTFMRHNRDYEDLFLIAACDRHVVANSSFSWWGAWLSGHHAEAVYPSRWYGPGFAHIDTTGLYPPGAKII